ncbi:MAG: hypothetical protein CEN89_658 [Candidatus Berkelbacteria bacterium Licking1014_7]|uniref:Uncharacterized protein n=1 Tax=Candidatus Berkelbacteria bacterium Licking1014_7 TaxID=2017147 RepID=A0A554LIL2_9BACT|nr:MAG: hypothetical protein CEN89_658 [Candidatus Berkelbacteria bacterium Licking1014_7]
MSEKVYLRSCIYYSEERCIGCEDWLRGETVSDAYQHLHYYCSKDTVNSRRAREIAPNSCWDCQDRVSPKKAEPKQHVEKLWVDFVCQGTVRDYARIIDDLNKALRSFSSSFEELTGKAGRIAKSSGRGSAMKIGDDKYYHGNVTLEFVYRSEHPLPRLFKDVVSPRLFEDCLNPILNSSNCAIIDNLYPGDYYNYLFRGDGKSVEEETAAVLERLKEMRPDIPEDFVKGILCARPEGAP